MECGASLIRHRRGTALRKRKTTGRDYLWEEEDLDHRCGEGSNLDLVAEKMSYVDVFWWTGMGVEKGDIVVEPNDLAWSATYAPGYIKSIFEMLAIFNQYWKMPKPCDIISTLNQQPSILNQHWTTTAQDWANISEPLAPNIKLILSQDCFLINIDCPSDEPSHQPICIKFWIATICVRATWWQRGGNGLVGKNWRSFCLLRAGT